MTTDVIDYRTGIPIHCAFDGPTKAISVIRVILRNIQRSEPQSARRLPQDPDTRCACGIHHLTPRPNQSRLPQVIDELYQMLHPHGGPPGRRRSRPFFSTLGSKDKYLASPKPTTTTSARQHHLLAPRFPPSRPRAARRRTPLLYTAGRWPHPLRSTKPAPSNELEKQPRRRRQSALEPEPFLQSIHAFRYVHL